MAGSLTKETFTEFLKHALKDQEIQSVFTGLLSEIVMGKLKEQEAEISSLKTKVENLEMELDDLEQYGRRNALRISGAWPESDNEKTDDIILKMAKDDLKVDLQPSDIDRSHRVGKKVDGKQRPILVKFTSYRSRNMIYRARTSLKGSGKSLYINEDLTQKKNSLAFMTRKAKRNGLLDETWTFDGKIFAIKDGVKHKLRTLEQLHKLAPQILAPTQTLPGTN